MAAMQNHTHTTAATVTVRVDGVPGVESETLAASCLGGARFVVRSVPCAATDVALGDIVECVQVDGRAHVDRVLVRGGGSTLRVAVEDADPLVYRRVVDGLVAAGCVVEAVGVRMLAVAVPPDAPVEGIRLLVDEWRESGSVLVAPGYTHPGAPGNDHP
jgi:hypothetical protein